MSLPTLGAGPGVISTGFTGILDGIVTQPDGAWDVYHRLTSAHTGNLIKIRRDSDDATQDIGYTASNVLDTAAIVTFLGGANGFLDTVYDQVGANDMVQATTTKQPAYTASGFNSQPSGDWDGTDDIMTAAGLAATFGGEDTPATFYITHASDDHTGTTCAWSYGNDNNNYNRFFYTSSKYQISRRGSGDSATHRSGGTTTASPIVITWSFSGTVSDMWADTTQVLTSQTQDHASITSGKFYWGAQVSSVPASFMNGDSTTLIAYATQLGSTDRDKIRDDLNTLKGL